jgi:hypothetical protein
VRKLTQEPGTTAPATSWYVLEYRYACQGSRPQGRGGQGRGSALPVHLVHVYRPSDIRVRIGQDVHVEDSGANGFELLGAAPSADTAFKDVAYDVTIAAT